MFRAVIVQVRKEGAGHDEYGHSCTTALLSLPQLGPPPRTTLRPRRRPAWGARWTAPRRASWAIAIGTAWATAWLAGRASPRRTPRSISSYSIGWRWRIGRRAGRWHQRGWAGIGYRITLRPRNREWGGYWRRKRIAHGRRDGRRRNSGGQRNRHRRHGLIRCDAYHRRGGRLIGRSRSCVRRGRRLRYRIHQRTIHRALGYGSGGGYCTWRGRMIGGASRR